MANIPKPSSLRWSPPLYKEKAPMLELSTIDILRSLKFLLKYDIVNDTFPWSCRLIGVEIVILHFGNLVYTFSA